MIPGPGTPEPDLVFHLCQRGTIEVPGDSSLEGVQRVGDEALRAPCILAGWEATTGVPKVCASNP